MTAGAFVRKQSRFRGRPEGGPERHHLYVALACPWSQRAAIVRAVLGLEGELGISYADPYRDERGWAFTGGRFTDDVNDFDFLKEAYEATEPGYDGRISVPVLWDSEEGRIVSNESADIVVFFNEWADGDLYPPDLREEIGALNEWIYGELQNGVYRAGFARSQEAYDEAFRGVFGALERLEGILSEVAETFALDDDQAPLLHDARLPEPEADHPRRPARPNDLHRRAAAPPDPPA